MQFKDGMKDAWDKGIDNNRDSYSAAIYAFAAQWAETMEIEVVMGGKEVKDVAEPIGKHLGWGGLTGFQYGIAVSILATVWEFGEELRQWHNLRYQLNGEGERANASGKVLNPALLNLGPLRGAS